ncbi:hypothetical protein F0562_018342 [Nyssa sinensis]|uniref:TCP domain-containing protein n=1 Tax=Nyssa sinensis TaxID=561372 RepID=A0A5J4Z8W6_9ASTE|nr:hypothetical protein F0562_018342 [Nyssa sinensis]
MQEGFGQASSKLGLKSTGGEKVEVHGGRIVLSTGRKDRHSKVCTAKGPRDRRVRLSANIAIQFYDVQDRLGYSRPSEAIDWLMKEAKAAIDALDELPVENPNAAMASAQQPEQDLEEHSPNHNHHHTPHNTEFWSSGYEIPNYHHFDDNPINSLSFFTPPSSTDFQNYPHELNSRTRCQTQDLSLCLQSFQEAPILLHHHLSPISSNEQALFTASTLLDFDATPTHWSNQQTKGTSPSQRMISWNSSSNSENEAMGEDDSPPQQLQSILGQNQFFSQRGPLQSSYLPSVPASTNPIFSNINYRPLLTPSSITGIAFDNDGFSGFCVSPPIQGQDKEQILVSDKPSSAASLLHYQD